MPKPQLDQDQREALRIVIEHCAPDLATIVAMHEAGCFLRAALDITLRLAGLTQDQLLEFWVEQAMTSE